MSLQQPFIISLLYFSIGTKIDLREDRETLSALAEQGLAPLKREQGQKLANKIRAVKYMECSALTQRGLKQVSANNLYTFHINRFTSKTNHMQIPAKGIRRGCSCRT